MDFLIIVINSLSVLMISSIIFVAWQRHVETSASQLVVLSVFMLIWAIGSFIEMGVCDINQKILWRNITQIGSFYTPAAALIFSITYSGILYNYRKKLACLLYTIQTIGIVLIFTDQFHHLARTDVFIVNSGSAEILVVNTTLLNKVLISFNFLYMVMSLIIMIMFVFFTTKKMRKQVFCVIIGMSISIGYSFIKVASNEMFNIEIPISGVFALADLFMLLGVVKYDLLMIAPIARNDVFHIIDDGIVITSSSGKIIDVNLAAIKMFNSTDDKECKGAHFISLENKIQNYFPQWHDALIHNRADKLHISKEGDCLTNYYFCDIYAVKNRNDKTIGNISVIKDITEQKMKNNLLKFRAEKDGLTGIDNRKTFIEKVENLLIECNEYVYLLFFDLDYFKQINDNYGHACGDFILKGVCNLIKARLNEYNLFGRMGGEEFAILLKMVDTEQMLKFAEEIRNDIEKNVFKFENNHINITISIGISFGGHISFDELYRLADLNLYKAKAAGRNCVIS